MQLVRNNQTNGTCKYALVRLDKMRKDGKFKSVPQFLEKFPGLDGYIEFGAPRSKEEFFVIKFKDLASTETLMTYAAEAKRLGDEEFSNEIIGLLHRTGEFHPNSKQADTDPSSYILEDINNPRSTPTTLEPCTNFGYTVDVSTHPPIISNPKILAKLYSSISSLEKHSCLDKTIASKLKGIYVRAYSPLSLFSEEDIERDYQNNWVEEKTCDEQWNCL